MVAVMDPKALSSNWKKLQETLKKKEATAPKPEESLKRKRPSEGSASSGNHAKNGIKKPYQKEQGTKTSAKRRKMGSTVSTQAPTTNTPSSNLTKSAASSSTTLALFAAENDLSLADVEAAYAKPPKSTDVVRSDDTINQGRNLSVVAGKFLAIDCEMVGVGPPPHDDSMLARVSIVNYHGHLLYDSYVLPMDVVKDYRTHISGIRAEHLRKGYARSFGEVQRDVAELLDGKVLVGHAVKNDLEALMLSHPKRDIRDTSRYPGYRALAGGKTPALKRLAKELLGVGIQSGEHSSIEDARATMLLYRREKTGFENELAKTFGRSVPKAVAQAKVDGDENDADRAARAEARAKRLKKKKQKKAK